MDLKKVCNALGTIILIFGIVGSIALAWNNGVTVSYGTYSIIEKRSILHTILWLVCGIIGTAIGTVILFALGEMLENQEMLFNKVSNMENSVNSTERKNRDLNDIEYNGSWKCSQCGRVNASYTGTCACGQAKR